MQSVPQDDPLETTTNISLPMASVVAVFRLQGVGEDNQIIDSTIHRDQLDSPRETLMERDEGHDQSVTIQTCLSGVRIRIGYQCLTRL